MKKGVYFITGIDTDIGKTIATGYLAKELLAKGVSVMTQKMVQTGCQTYAEDIISHRKMMGIPLCAEDKAGLTMPEIYSYPASPHLAAKIDNRALDLDKIQAATEELAKRFDVVLLEGAGGLMVPLQEDVLTIDYIAKQQYTVILVTSGKLGSINHTLLSLEALKQRQISLYALVYNTYFDSNDAFIAEDTERYLQNYLQQYYPQALYWRLPVSQITQ